MINIACILLSVTSHDITATCKAVRVKEKEPVWTPFMRSFPHTLLALWPAGPSTNSAQFWSDKTRVHDNTSAKLFSHTPVFTG